MNLKDLSDTELKAFIYDESQKIQLCKHNITQAEQVLYERIKVTEEAKPVEKNI